LFSSHAAGVAKESGESPGLTDAAEQLRAVPIGDYGFLSDGEVSALVAPAGTIDWMCVPRFDAPSVFGAILGRRGGAFTVSPLDARVPAARRYLPGTMILETSWGTPTGWMIVRDVLLIGPWHHEADRSDTSGKMNRWARTDRRFGRS
jgi:GH15 family glucan-1,4-alpha-glucosidase